MSFWYVAPPFLLIGLGLVVAFLGAHSLLRRVWPPIVKLRPDWEVRDDRTLHVHPDSLLRSEKPRADFEKLSAFGNDRGPNAA